MDERRIAQTAERYRWHKRMLGDSGLTPTDRLVGAALWDHWNKEKGTAHPGIRHLAERLGVSERTVRRGLVNLRGRKWIEELTRGSVTEERKWATVYQFTWPPGEPPPATPDHRSQVAAGEAPDHRPPVADHRPLMAGPLDTRGHPTQ